MSVAGAASLARAAAPAPSVDTPQQEIARQVPAALKILDAWQADRPERADGRTLHLVYWTPADREPAPNFRPRLSRVLRDVQAFYKAEMARMGFGPRTFRLADDADGLVKIHVVKGAKPYADYNVDSGRAIRVECLPTLKAAGIDADKETVVIFCNMSNWDAAARTMNQNSPYYAGGGLRGGTAWQVDSPLLDSALLADVASPKLTDKQYGKITIGKYNSIFVGGVAHELGHALGLPHDAERPDQRAAFGTALMGGGNRTYGDDRRKEGRGSFLTLAEGFRLAAHPLFTASVKGIDLGASARLSDVTVEPAEDGKSFTLAAAVTADPPAYAVVGYADPAGGGDYDATTATAVPDAAGRITLRVTALKAGKPGTLRVVVCQANGGRIGDKTLAVPYAVAADGAVDLTSFYAMAALAPVVKAVNAGDANAAAAAVKSLEAEVVRRPAGNSSPGSASSTKSAALLVDVGRTLAGTLTSKPGPSPADAKGEACRLPDATWQSATVGWGKPAANRLPGDSALLRAGGQLFARGLYAHAPSTYRYDLGGNWARLTAKSGIASGMDGSVVFVVLGDGKELWRSAKLRGDELADVNVDVAGVKALELRVENAGDGNSGDWGTWLEPTLDREPS